MAKKQEAPKAKSNGNGKVKSNGKLTQREAEILKHLKKQDWSIPGIADSTKPKTSEEEAVKIIDALVRKGYDINYDRSTKRVILVTDPVTMEPLRIDPEKCQSRDPIYRHTYRVGLWSSAVAGSKFSQFTLLHTLYAKFEAMGVDFIVGSDLTAGLMAKRRRGEVFIDDSEEQKDYVLRHFPRTNRIKTYIISGKRDLSFKSREDPAYNIVRDICSARDDLIYRGDLSSTFFIKNARIVVTNPGEDFAPYAKSLPLQRIMENMYGENNDGTGNEDKEILALFGSHMYDDQPEYMIARGFLVPTLQAMTPHQRARRRRGFAPILGGVVLHLHFDDKWQLKENGIEVELINLTPYQQTNDYLADARIKESLTKKQAATVELLAERPRTEGELSRVLKIHKDTVAKTVDQLKESGYKILTPSDPKQFDSKQFALDLKPKTAFKSLNLAEIFAKSVKVGFTSDKHYASLDGQPSCVDMAYRDAEEAKIAAMFDTGDMTAGLFDHPANRNKVLIPGVEGQMLYAADRHPRPSFRQIHITGDHDLFGKIGINVFRHVFAHKRPDIEYLGHLKGQAEVNGLKTMLMHPGGGPGYALSFGGQKRIESEILRTISRGGKERYHVLALGNWHVANLQFNAGVAVVEVPCFQEQTIDYMMRKGLTPWIGMWVIEFTLDTKERITSMRAKYYNYAPYTKDLDLPEPIAGFFRKYVFPDLTAGENGDKK